MRITRIIPHVAKKKEAIYRREKNNEGKERERETAREAV